MRSHDEFIANGIPGTRHVLGGQLVQATDQYVGVRGCRVILMDDEMVRAPMMANWIHQLGYEVAVLDGGVEALRNMRIPQLPVFTSTPVAQIESQADLAHATILDLRSVNSFRRGHIKGAVWTIRPLLESLNLASDATVVLISADDIVAALAAQRLAELGVENVRRLVGDEEALSLIHI